MTGWHGLRSPRRFRGGMKNLAVVEAPNSEMEALAIAVAMREARHLGQSAALVTPDRALARRVIAALTRWNLEFDDSGGDALMDTSAGTFARLAAEAAAKGLEPPTLLALLKHPLFRLGRRARRAQATPSKYSNWRCCAAPGRKPEAAASQRDFDRFRTELGKLSNQEIFLASPTPSRAHNCGRTNSIKPQR